MLRWILSALVLTAIILIGLLVFLAGAAYSILKFALGAVLVAILIVAAALLTAGRRFMR